MSDVPVVAVRELDAMIRAYPPGKRIQVVVPVRDARGDVEVGVEVEVRSELGPYAQGRGAKADGKVLRRAFIVEVTIPEEDAVPLVDENQGTLG